MPNAAVIARALLVALAGAPAAAPAFAGPSAPACASIPTIEDGVTPTAFIHVSPGGRDAGGDGSPENPYGTIAFAAALAGPGDAVVAHEGVYAGGGFIVDVDGAPGAPIWIGGAPGEARPLIQGGSEGLHFIKCSHLIVHDLEVAGPANNGINCDDGGEVANPLAAHHIVFRDLYIHDVGGSGNQDGLKLSGLNDFWVLDCRIETTGGGVSGSLIDMVGCRGGVIARCELSDASGSGIQVKGGSQDVEVRWCRFEDAGQRSLNIGGSTGFQFFRPPLDPDGPNAEARDIRAASNLFIGSVAPIAFVGAVDCVVANNTIVTPGSWIMRILQETLSSDGFEFLACSNNVFVNNVAWFDSGELSAYVNIGPNTAPETFDFTSNLWYAFDEPGASTPSLPAPETDGIYGQPPGFVDGPGGDYSIGVDAAAAGSGAPTALATADLAGRCYCGPSPSRGAWEAGITGDLDGDGGVSSSDLNVLLGVFGGPGSVGDLDGDGSVGSADLNVLLAAFGASCL